MKKFVAVMVLCCFAMAAYAQSESVGSVAGMIKDDLFKNQAAIKSASASLSQTQKMALYGEYKKDQWVPFLINFVVGAGIGSFIEGDKTGGIIALVGDLSGVGAVAIGAVSYASAVASNPYTTSGLGIMTVGYLIIAGSRIFEIIRPFTFTANYNSSLKSSLGYLEGFSLVPSFENGMAGLTLGCKVRLN